MRRLIFLCSLIFFLACPSIIAGQSDMVVDLTTRINRERIANGLTPYALNAQLTKSAQAHADDIARTQQYGHIGSDGSNTQQRVERAGYGKYSWGFRVGENWAHYSSAASAFAMWMDSTPHRNNILHAYYREIGIGIAPTRVGLFVFVIDFGAQPNALPFFINDGATETRATTVTLTLSDDQVAPSGDGNDRIGHPTQVLISNSTDFSNARWQPYERKIDWTLAPSNGTQTIFIQYRDARNRTAIATQSISLKIPASPTPTRTVTLTPRPTDIFTATPIPTETPPIPSTPVPTLTPTATPSIDKSSGDGISTTVIVSVLGVAMMIGGASIISRYAKESG